MIKAAELYRELYREAPEEHARTGHLAGTLVNLGTADWIAGKLNDAEQVFQEASELLERSLGKLPSKAAFETQFVLVQLLLNRGNLAIARDQPQAALLTRTEAS